MITDDVYPFIDNSLRVAATSVGLSLYSFHDLERIGFAHPQPSIPPSPDDLSTFSYTSGTTGNPKGAMLTHTNFMTVFASGKEIDTQGLDAETHMSYLPLAHVYERTITMAVLGTGGSLGFFQGNPEKLIDDLQALKPSSIPVVPRVVNRMYDKIMQGVSESSPLRQKLFSMAYESQLLDLHKNGKVTKGFWDKLVFSKIRKMLGFENLRMMITGAAPIAPHVLNFMRVMLACPVVEGYGQTETTALTTVGSISDVTTGHVGCCVPSCEIKLVDVPDMGYFHHDTIHNKSIPCRGRGEICVRGPNVFKGYYKLPEKTAEVFDEEGWMHSGDIGMWDLQGRLIIIDRKKNIFKLAQGEYIAPEKIENIFSQSNLVAQSFVYGDSLQSSLVAIIVPDEEVIMGSWLKNQANIANKDTITFSEICKSATLKEQITADLQIVSARAGLNGFEMVKDIFLHPEMFTPESGILTVTLKLKRDVAKEKFKDIIQSMYNELNAAKLAGRSEGQDNIIKSKL